MPGHLLHGEEQPELPYFIYFGFPPSLGADQEGSGALSKPQHLHRIHREHHLRPAAVPKHTDRDRVLAQYPPPSSPGTFLDAQGIGVNVLSITVTAR